MHNNRVALLAGFLVLLLGVAYLTGVFDSAPSTIEVPDVTVPTAEVNSLVVESGEWTATMTKEGGVWRITEPLSARADSAVIARLLNSIGGLEISTIVSSSPDRYANYGVDETSGRSVTLTWEGGEQRLVVAAQGPDFSTSYLRIGNTPEVYTGSRIAIPEGLDQLRDKTLVSIPIGMVQSVQVEAPEFSYQLMAGDAGWMVSEQGAEAVQADSAQVAAWLRRFAPLRLDGFRDELTRDSLDVSHSLTFELAGGSRTEVVFEQTEADLLAFSPQGPGVMDSFASRVRTLVQEPDVLRATQ